MNKFIPEDVFHILRNLSRTPMTNKQLSETLNSTRILGWVKEADPGSIERVITLLQRWGLIQWASQREASDRIYHITEMGRRFLKDYFLIEGSRFFEEYRGPASAALLDTLEKKGRSQYINTHRTFIQRMIGRIRKSQSTLKKEKARALLLQYHLYRLQGELVWLRGISDSQGSQNEQK